MNQYLSLTKLSPVLRPADWPVAVDGRRVITWRDFLSALSALRRNIEKNPAAAWRLHAEDHALFLIGLIALLQCGKHIHLTASLPASPSAPGEEPPLASDQPAGADLILAIPDTDAGATLPDCPSVDPDRFLLFFHTSGSSGAPKTVAKTFIQVEAELVNLAGIWGDRFHGATVFSTVSPQHFYGFLFTGLLPFCTGARLYRSRILYPETLTTVLSADAVVVTSPAFLKRADHDASSAAPPGPPRLVISSGGFLPEASARKNRAWFGTDVTEIYGSTETGGIAWRRSPGDAPWKPFPGVIPSATDSGTLDIASPYLPPPGRDVIEDLVEFEPDGGFRLFGRADSIVKIEEKRVALNDVENRLMETGLVADAVVAALEAGRQFLAAALVLNDKGKSQFHNTPKIKMNRFFAAALRPHFHPIVIPRQWRFLETSPRNAQGKITAAARRGLFTGGPEPVKEPKMTVLEHAADRAVLELTFPQSYVHFEGHFEEMKILPAVAQMDWAMKYTASLFNVPAAMRELSVFKLKKPIFPDTPVRLALELQREKHRLRFSFTDPSGRTLYSQGAVLLGSPA